LIADLRGHLDRTDPVYHLTNGLDESSRHLRINPRRFGERTKFEHACHKFAVFKKEEVTAIVAYLNWRRDEDEFERKRIDEALRNYWYDRAA